MIARPKISRNERKTTEIGAFEVGNFAPFSCPGGAPLRDLTAARKREGEDIFYTELFEYDEDGSYVHYADGGVATCASASVHARGARSFCETQQV